MIIKLTSYVTDSSYGEKNGLITANRQVETPCLLAVDEISFVFEALETIVGRSQIKLKSGTMITVKESLDEIFEMVNPRWSDLCDHLAPSTAISE